MEVNQSTLNTLFKTYSAVFNKAVNSTPSVYGKRDVKVEDIAMIVQSTGASTTHAWINQIPGFKKWVGERTLNTLKAGTLTVVNEDFEDTVVVPRNAIEDDSYGVFAAPIAALGDAARDLWLQLAIQALVKNDNWADNNKFFCTGRLFVDGGTPCTNASKDALNAANLQKAIAAMRGWKLDGGRATHVIPTTLLVGPDQEYLAAKLVETDLVAEGEVTTSNVLKNVLTVKVHADIPAGQWYVLAEKNTIKPIAVQKRKEAVLTGCTGESDESVFMRNEFLYGGHARGEAFLTMPFLAYAGGLSEVTAWAEANS